MHSSVAIVVELMLSLDVEAWEEAEIGDLGKLLAVDSIIRNDNVGQGLLHRNSSSTVTKWTREHQGNPAAAVPRQCHGMEAEFDKFLHGRWIEDRNTEMFECKFLLVRNC